MSVLNRKLFSRGGKVSSRGVGITSGLVDQPVQKFNNGGLAEKYRENLEMLKGLDLFPETKPVSKLQAFSPALIKLGAGLMSNRSLQGGFGGGLDILGQSVEGASPEIQQATQTILEDKAKDPDAALRETALSLALKDDDKTEFSDPTEVTIRYEGSDKNVPALRTFNKNENSFVYQTTAGDPIDAETTPFKVIRDEEPINWSNPTDVKVLLDNGIKTDAVRTFNPADNVFSWTIPGQVEKLTPGTFKQIDDGSDGSWTGATQVELLKKGDESGGTVDAIRVLDDDEFKFINPVTNSPYNMAMYDVLTDDLTKNKVQETLDGVITIDGKEKNVDFVETDQGLKILDFRPTIDNKPNPNFGKMVDINEIDGITSFNVKPKKEILSVEEELKKLEGEKDIETKNKIASNIAETITSAGLKANSVIQNTQDALALLETSADGSFIEGRTGFVRLLKTFNVDKALPDLYKTVEDFALQGGNLPSTETSIALAKQLTLGRATEWNQQLNNTEVGLLIDAGPQVGLTKEGQRLLLETNLFNAQVNKDAYNLYNDLVLNQNKTNVEAVKLVNDFRNKKYQEYAKQTKDRIQEVLNYKSVRDKSFFAQQKDITIVGEDVNLEKAYEDGQLAFAGYADADGIFRITKKNGDVIEQRVLRKDLPVYFYYHTNGKVYGLEGGVKLLGQ
tara:strand:+ start:51 stop:2081 length:2031 start_codon:yes stop_codon:yes gene_type:complete